MKKIALMGALALCLGFTSCDGYEEPNPQPQTNPQEPVFSIEGITVEDAQAGQVVDLAQYDSENQAVPVLNVALTDFPSTSDLNIVMEIASSSDFTKVGTLETTYADGVVTVAPDALQGIYNSVISKSPKQKTIYARYAAYAVNGNESVRLGDPSTYFGPFELTVLPMASDLVIEDNYYLLGTINGWSVATAIKFNHSDANPYDDPVFTLKVEITEEEAEAGWWWKVVPESTYVTGDWVSAANASYGVEENGDESIEGMLVARTADEDCGAGCLTTAGQLLMTINLEEGTYSFTSAVDYLYTPGDANGWSQTSSQMLATEDYANYFGYAVLSPNGYKFTNAPDWNHTNYGSTGEEGTLSTDPGAGNLSVSTLGLYYCKVNTASLTYSVEYISTIGVIGDATPEGWNASTALTPSSDFLTWTGTVTLGGGELKFRANDAWTINLGGSFDNLVADGANIASPGAGTYKITLDLSALPYSATLVKQ
jgi:hypothetical protein